MNYQELKAIVQGKGYKFFDNGDYNINLVFKRTSDDFTDKFTDMLYIAYRVNGAEQLITIPATTKAGSHYVQNPITYYGVTGTAVIIPGQYLGVYQFIDDYSTWLNYPFFKQIKGMNYWRDFDLDGKIDKVQVQTNQIFGTHIHRMSAPGVVGTNIGNWSAGCMGAVEPEYKKILPIIRESVKKYGSTLSMTLLD